MVNDALALCSTWCYGVVMCTLLCSVVTPSYSVLCIKVQ